MSSLCIKIVKFVSKMVWSFLNIDPSVFSSLSSYKDNGYSSISFKSKVYQVNTYKGLYNFINFCRKWDLISLILDGP